MVASIHDVPCMGKRCCHLCFQEGMRLKVGVICQNVFGIGKGSLHESRILPSLGNLQTKSATLTDATIP